MYSKKMLVRLIVSWVLVLSFIVDGIAFNVSSADAGLKKPKKAVIKSVKENDEGEVLVTLKNTGADQYVIYRSEVGSNDYSKIGYINLNYETSYVDDSCVPGKSYNYKARGMNFSYTKKKTKSKMGDFSEEAQVKYELRINTTAVDENTIQISSNFSSSLSVNSCILYRSDNEKSGFSAIATKSSISGGFSYKDNTAVLGKKYYYKIKLSVISDEYAYEKWEFEKAYNDEDSDSSSSRYYVLNGRIYMTNSSTATATPRPTSAYRIASGSSVASGVAVTTAPAVTLAPTATPKPTNPYVTEIESNVKVGMSGPSKTKFKKISVAKFKVLKFKWNKVNIADGYEIYRYANSEYEKVATISSNKTSYKLKNVEHGSSYNYVVAPYIMVNGEKIIGQFSKSRVGIMNYYSCEAESYTDRAMRIFGKKKKKESYGSASNAASHMTSFSIRIWDFANGKSGRKITKRVSLTMNKKIAPSVKRIFEEIYKGKEKFPIHSIGGYSYRWGEHGLGLAIDINPNENYEKTGKKITCGTLYQPGKNPYSIPTDGEVAKIMNKYGFTQGLWGNKVDYMHFSYFGG